MISPIDRLSRQSECPASIQPRTVKFLDLAKLNARLRPVTDAAIQRICDRCDFILGEEVTAFEKAFAEYVGAKYCIGVASGLDALTVVLQALGVGPGDEVIVPANTFVATALAVTRTGARPVLVDVNKEDFNIDAKRVESAITKKTRAVIPVHLYGKSCTWEALQEISDRYSITMLEDACQAHGATYKGRKCGSLGIAGAFSFYPGKNLGCFGDGGAVTTDDQEIFTRAAQIRNYGQSEKYLHQDIGGNSRLDTIQAAVLRVKLPLLDDWNQRRRINAETYRARLGDVDEVCLPSREDPASRHVFHLFVIHVEGRDDLKAYLEREGVQTGLHYPKPIHLQPCYADLGYSDGDFPVAEWSSRHLLSLPMGPTLEVDEVNYVCDKVRHYFRGNR